MNELQLLGIKLISVPLTIVATGLVIMGILLAIEKITGEVPGPGAALFVSLALVAIVGLALLIIGTFF